MPRRGATPRQKEYLKKVGERFGISIDVDRIQMMDVVEATKAVGIMKNAERVADWLSNADQLPMFTTS